VHKENCADGFGGVSGSFFEQEQLHSAVFCLPMFLAFDGGGRLAYFIHGFARGARQLMGGI
jgi:hypothetical protein